MTSESKKQIAALQTEVAEWSKFEWEAKNAKDLIAQYDTVRRTMQRLGMAINTWITQENLPVDHVRHLPTHEASGLLVHCREKKSILVVKDQKTGKWTIPGGKGQGSETALQTALREFSEETGNAFSKSTIETLHKACLPSYYYPQGRYVLFFLNSISVWPPFSSKEAKTKMVSLSDIGSLEWTDFAKAMLSDVVVKAYLGL